MRTLLTTVATIGALAVSAAAQVAAAHAATSAQKPSEHAAVGVNATPDRRPADPRAPMLRRASGAGAALTVAPPSVEKPQSFGTSSPADPASLSAAQRRKLADASAAREPVEASEGTGVKPAERSTIVRLEAGARAPSIESRNNMKLTIEAQPAGRMNTNSLTRVLGVIPRPEWSAGLSPAKPKEVSTIGTVPNDPAPRPPAPESQRRTVSGAKARVGPKPPEVSTSAPRDPSLPPPSATKLTPAPSTKQEVQP